MSCSKSDLRKNAKVINSGLGSEYRNFADFIIFRSLVECQEFKEAGTVFIYASTDSEPSTTDIISFAFLNEKRVCVPKCVSEGVMIPVEIKSLTELKNGYMNIPEPAAGSEYTGKIDIAVVPCVSASPDGRRLGHGKGFYDRFLKSKEIYKICLCYSALLNDDIPVTEEDVIMDKVIFDNKPVIIAHRSGPVDYPEQTVSAAKQALEFGADMIEIDLRINIEGDIIVSHDDNAMRVFGVDKDVCTMTAKEFASLKHIDSPSFSSCFLKDYIDNSVSPLLLHLKNEETDTARIIDYLESINFSGRYVIGVKWPETIKMIKKLNPDIPVLAFIKNPDYIDDCISAGADYIRLWQGNTTSDRIKFIHSKGRKVWIMTGGCNGYEVGYTDRKFLSFILTEKVDGILINDVRLDRILSGGN